MVSRRLKSSGGRWPVSLRRLLASSRLFDLYRAGRAPWELHLWRRGRLKNPPPLFKQRLVGDFARRFATPILVETGTFFGDMLAAHGRTFRRLYSTELDPWLYHRARRRFARRDNVELLHGDSAELLPSLLPRLEEPCLFWLDAHAMVGGVRGARTTPIREELEAILAAKHLPSVILVDDIRLFTGGDYPPLHQVRERILECRPGWTVEVRNDVLRAYDPASEVPAPSSQ